MSKLSKFLWGSKHSGNPSNAAQPWLQKAADTQQPYINQGQQAGNQLNAQNEQMAQNPTDFYNNIMKDYTRSSGYQTNLDEQLRASGNSAAAGGMRGSQFDQENAQRIANSMSTEDMQKWYENQMGIGNAGRAGQQHTSDQGFEASNNLANQYNNMGQNAYQGKDYENKRRQSQIDQLMKFISGGAGAAVGAATGGIPGALAGSQGNYNTTKFI